MEYMANDCIVFFGRGKRRNGCGESGRKGNVMEMQPTMNLRFVLRAVQVSDGTYGLGLVRSTAHVLQQQWTNSYGRSEWRDIPAVREEDSP